MLVLSASAKCFFHVACEIHYSKPHITGLSFTVEQPVDIYGAEEIVTFLLFEGNVLYRSKTF